MKQLQEASVKSGKCFSGEEKKPKQIISKRRSDTVEEHEMEDLAESLLKQWINFLNWKWFIIPKDLAAYLYVYNSSRMIKFNFLHFQTEIAL